MISFDTALKTIEQGRAPKGLVAEARVKRRRPRVAVSEEGRKLWCRIRPAVGVRVEIGNPSELLSHGPRSASPPFFGSNNMTTP